jgi:hypothetical protein
MNETQNQLAKAPISAGKNGLKLQNLEEMWRFSKAVAVSGMAPKGIESPEAILIALQMGAELGLPPMASLQNIAVINGRPSVWGDAQLGVVRATGELEEFDEWFEVDGKRIDRNPSDFKDNTTAVCHVKRTGDKEPGITAFSVADAKRANLWGKQGPWSQYPYRMLRFRARSFGLRDRFGDALRGLLTVEEVRDLPKGEVIDITGETISFTDAIQAEPEIPNETKKRGRPRKEVETVVEVLEPKAEEKIEEVKTETTQSADWALVEETLLENLLAKADEFGAADISKQAAVIQMLSVKYPQVAAIKTFSKLPEEIQEFLLHNFEAVYSGRIL